MLAQVQLSDRTIKVDLSKPMDISMGLSAINNPTAWYVSQPTIEPVVGEGFVGEVAQGGSVNFKNISFNPHGHGTHTECVGHISKDFLSVNDVLKTFFFDAELISLLPTFVVNEELGRKKGDTVITLAQIKEQLKGKSPQAVVIRTLPNSSDKLSKNYSNTNPTYICHLATAYLREIGVKHLLIDTPSVDREEDEGRLLAHRAFWDYPATMDNERTITELIYVKDTIKDGAYLLNLQMASFVNDASPSKPVLYQIID